LAALLAVLVYAGDIAYGAFIDNASAFQNTDTAVVKHSETPAPTPQPSVSATVAPTPTPDPYDLLLQQADLDFMKNRVNILVLGIDESLERADWQTFRTDTMLLMSIDFDTNDVCMISLPRDSYVWIYNQDKRDKINTAFSEGGGYKKNGFEYAMKTVSMVLGGVPVNNYVCFDMNVVKEVVNAIGGLSYDVDVNVNMCGRKIEKGYQHLDGQMVLDYCRQRHGSSDIARVDRQQRMILAIFNEIKSTGQLGDIPAIYSAVTGNIYTDLSLKQIASLAAFAMKVDLESIERHTLPGGFLNIDGTSFWGVDLSQTRNLIKDIFGVKIKINEADDLDTLLALAQEKRNVVAAAQTTAANAEGYVNANTGFISPEELADFQSRIANLRGVAAVKNTEDVSLTLPPIYAAMDEFNAYFASFQGTVEARKAEAAAAAAQTPAPEAPAPEPVTTESAAEVTPAA
jgi:LCP family protein required for cell wall assembly